MKRINTKIKNTNKTKTKTKTKNLKTKTHEWIKVENGIATVGLDVEVKEAIGEIVHIELPKVGKKYKKGEEICVLESSKSAFDLYAPLTGKITEVNKRLFKEIELINKEPERQGWLYKMELADLKELKDLKEPEKC